MVHRYTRSGVSPSRFSRDDTAEPLSGDPRSTAENVPAAPAPRAHTGTSYSGLAGPVRHSNREPGPARTHPRGNRSDARPEVSADATRSRQPQQYARRIRRSQIVRGASASDA